MKMRMRMGIRVVKKIRMTIRMRMRLKMGMVMFVFWRQLRDSYLAFRKKRNQKPRARLTMACLTILSWHMVASKIFGEAVAMQLPSA